MVWYVFFTEYEFIEDPLERYAPEKDPFLTEKQKSDIIQRENDARMRSVVYISRSPEYAETHPDTKFVRIETLGDFNETPLLWIRYPFSTKHIYPLQSMDAATRHLAAEGFTPLMDQPAAKETAIQYLEHNVYKKITIKNDKRTAEYGLLFPVVFDTEVDFPINQIFTDVIPKYDIDKLSYVYWIRETSTKQKKRSEAETSEDHFEDISLFETDDEGSEKNKLYDIGASEDISSGSYESTEEDDDVTMQTIVVFQDTMVSATKDRRSIVYLGFVRKLEINAIVSNIVSSAVPPDQMRESFKLRYSPTSLVYFLVDSRNPSYESPFGWHVLTVPSNTILPYILTSNPPNEDDTRLFATKEDVLSVLEEEDYITIDGVLFVERNDPTDTQLLFHPTQDTYGSVYDWEVEDTDASESLDVPAAFVPEVVPRDDRPGLIIVFRANNITSIREHAWNDITLVTDGRLANIRAIMEQHTRPFFAVKKERVLVGDGAGNYTIQVPSASEFRAETKWHVLHIPYESRGDGFYFTVGWGAKRLQPSTVHTFSSVEEAMRLLDGLGYTKISAHLYKNSDGDFRVLIAHTWKENSNIAVIREKKLMEDSGAVKKRAPKLLPAPSFSSDDHVVDMGPLAEYDVFVDGEAETIYAPSEAERLRADNAEVQRKEMTAKRRSESSEKFEFTLGTHRMEIELVLPSEETLVSEHFETLQGPEMLPETAAIVEEVVRGEIRIERIDLWFLFIDGKLICVKTDTGDQSMEEWVRAFYRAATFRSSINGRRLIYLNGELIGYIQPKSIDFPQGVSQLHVCMMRHAGHWVVLSVTSSVEQSIHEFNLMKRREQYDFYLCYDAFEQTFVVFVPFELNKITFGVGIREINSVLKLEKSFDEIQHGDL